MSGEYQTFTMRDFETEGEPLLAKVDYLVEMFDLEVRDDREERIVITLREKKQHATERQERESAAAFAERAWSGNS